MAKRTKSTTAKKSKSVKQKPVIKAPTEPTKMKVSEYLDTLRERFGSDPKNWKVICPMCKTIQSVQEFHEAGIIPADGVFGYSCIGRFSRVKKGCNWTLGGLFQAHTLILIDTEGNEHPRFEIAPKDA